METLKEHYLVDLETNKKYYLKIPDEYTFGTENVIIVKESATGDGAIVINNGRRVEEIPITGTLFAVDIHKNSKISNSMEGLKQLNENIQDLMMLKDNNKSVLFVKPFHTEGANKYFIKSLQFTTLNDDNSINFNMTLIENKTENIFSIEKKLKLRSGYVQALIEANKTLEGIPDDTDSNADGHLDWDKNEYKWNTDKQDVFTVTYWKQKYEILRADFENIKNNIKSNSLYPLIDGFITGIKVLLTPFAAKSFHNFLDVTGTKNIPQKISK